MTKKRKITIPLKPLPIVVVPDKTYIGATGDMIPTDVILVADVHLFRKMKKILTIWEQEQKGIPG